jgi:hypothetical protein
MNLSRCARPPSAQPSTYFFHDISTATLRTWGSLPMGDRPGSTIWYQIINATTLSLSVLPDSPCQPTLPVAQRFTPEPPSWVSSTVFVLLRLLLRVLHAYPPGCVNDIGSSHSVELHLASRVVLNSYLGVLLVSDGVESTRHDVRSTQTVTRTRRRTR